MGLEELKNEKLRGQRYKEEYARSLVSKIRGLDEVYRENVGAAEVGSG